MGKMRRDIEKKYFESEVNFQKVFLCSNCLRKGEPETPSLKMFGVFLVFFLRRLKPKFKFFCPKNCAEKMAMSIKEENSLTKLYFYLYWR